MIVTEIIHETSERTRIKARRNGKRIIITGSIFAVLLTTLFYSFGIPQQDHLYGSMPVLASIPLVLLSSFNAVGMSSIMIFFLWAFGESTHYVVKNSLEQRHQKKIEEEAKAVRNQFNQYGHQDYSLQIDEAKAGLEHKISGTENLISELAKRFNVKSLATDWRVSKLERKVQSLETQLEEYKRKESEREQTISKKSLASNNTENTKTLDDSNKIEFLDE